MRHKIFFIRFEKKKNNAIAGKTSVKVQFFRFNLTDLRYTYWYNVADLFETIRDSDRLVKILDVHSLRP